MADLSGEEGVLPLLDVDPARSPRWFVMPVAQPLADSVAFEPNLRDVVALIEPLAETLVRLAAKGIEHRDGIAHRDIKPDNLFMLNGNPVLGDFGIATWPRRDHLTRTGGKVGPAVFLAPEARQHTRDIDYHRADVWSLAKTLFTLARPELGKYPHEGTHVVGELHFSLWPAGRESAPRLEYLLQAATQVRPHERPSMAEFHTELRDWLALYPAGRVVRHVRTPGRASFEFPDEGHEVMRRRLAQFALRAKTLRDMLAVAMSSIAESLIGERAAWADDPGALRGDHGEPEQPDELVVLASTRSSTGLRLVLGAALYGDRATYLAEWQGTDDHGDAIVLDGPMAGHDVRFELPSGQQRLNDFVLDVLGRKPQL